MAYGKGSLVKRQRVTICGRECVIKVYERKEGDEWKVSITDEVRDTRCSKAQCADFEEAFNTAVTGAEASILAHQQRLAEKKAIKAKAEQLINESPLIDVKSDNE